jgi:regulation of enolase protein 1 (concanavalin A-like superfamily)
MPCIFYLPLLSLVLCVPTLAAEDRPGRQIKGWGEVTDPEGDCQVTEDQGKLTLVVPGTYHDLWPGKGKVNAPRVLQKKDGDFAVQVNVAGTIRAEKDTAIPGLASVVPYHAGSLLIWQDEQNFVRLERGCMIQQAKPVFFCYYQAFKEGKNVVRLSKTTKDASLYLRLERRGGNINASMSYDGRTWQAFKGQAIKLPEQVQVGVSAVNNTSKPLTAVFEDFTITPRSK